MIADTVFYLYLYLLAGFMYAWGEVVFNIEDKLRWRSIKVMLGWPVVVLAMTSIPGPMTTLGEPKDELIAKRYVFIWLVIVLVFFVLIFYGAAVS